MGNKHSKKRIELNEITISNTMDYATTNFKTHIINNIIKPNYINEINDSTKYRNLWKKRGMRLETCSKFFIGLGSIMSFASGVYGYQTLSFVAGAISTISLVLLQYSNFAYKESKKATQDLNLLLDNLGIKKVPELNANVQDESNIKDISKEKSNVGMSFINNPLSINKTPIDMINAINHNNLDEIKRLYEIEKIDIPNIIFIDSIINNNMEMFKYALYNNVKQTVDTLNSIITYGNINFIKEYFNAGYTYDFTLYNGELSPLYYAVQKNDIEVVKYIYSKCPIWTKGIPSEVLLAKKNNNKEILDFCLENGALNDS